MTVQLLRGKARLVVLITVKDPPKPFVKVNWTAPLLNISAPVNKGGMAAPSCVTGTAWPSKEM